MEPLTEVVGSAKSKDLLAAMATTTAQRNCIQYLGFMLGVAEWGRSFQDRLSYPAECLARLDIGGPMEDVIVVRFNWVYTL